VYLYRAIGCWHGHFCRKLAFAVVFTRESFQRVLAIAILSVRPSVCHTGGSVKNGLS